MEDVSEWTMMITISRKNEVYLHIKAEESILCDLNDFFRFRSPGYMFSPQYKRKFWDGYINLFSLKTNLIYYGLFPRLETFFEERGLEYEWYLGPELNTRNYSLHEGETYCNSLNLSLIPRDYQVAGFTRGIRYKKQLLLSPTSSGKSLIAYTLCRKLIEEGKRGLIIVPTINLVTQLYGDFKDYSSKNKWDVEENVHQIYEGQDKQTDKPLIISTWQSLKDLKQPYFEKFGFLIGDEVHSFTAKSLTGIATKCINAEYRIGLTATIQDAKAHILTLEGLFGSVHNTITTKKLMDRGDISTLKIKCLMLKYPEEECKKVKAMDYRGEIGYLISDVSRNNFICNLALSLKGNTLILYQYVEKHGELLYNTLEGKAKDGRKVFFIHGKVDGDVRNEIRGIVEKEKDAIIVASLGTFAIGVNIRNIHNLIFATPSKGKIRVLQSIGRALRLGTEDSEKECATLFDIIDDLSVKKHLNFALKHFLSRVQLYIQEKFSYKIYKIKIGE